MALDKSRNKVEQIEANCRRLKIPTGCVRCHAFDATKSCSADAESDADFAPPFPPETFDRILLDAPCSALGQRPQLLNRMSAKELASFPRLQRRLFSAAAALLKPGGTLVYSTCTVTLEENEMLAAWAGREHEELLLEDANSGLERRIEGKDGIWLKDGLTEEECRKVLRFSCISSSTTCDGEEDCASDTIGFFIAKFKKKL